MVLPLFRTRRRPRSARPARLLSFDILEERTVLSGRTLSDPLAVAIQNNVAQASDFFAGGQDFRIYRLDNVVAGDTVTAQVNAQQVGSGLNSFLRVFDSSGHQIG